MRADDYVGEAPERGGVRRWFGRSYIQEGCEIGSVTQRSDQIVLDDLGAAVTARLSSPAGIAIYLVGVTALGLHLSHAVQSALQTLGAAHPKYTPLLRGLGLFLAVVLFVGFASFPIYGLFLGAGVDR